MQEFAIPRYHRPAILRPQQIQMEITDGKTGHQRTEITLGDLSLSFAVCGASVHIH